MKGLDTMIEPTDGVCINVTLEDLASLSEDDSAGVLADTLRFTSEETTFFFSCETFEPGDFGIPWPYTTPTTETGVRSLREELVSIVTVASEVSDLSIPVFLS